MSALEPESDLQAGAGRKDVDLQSVKLAGKQLSKEQYMKLLSLIACFASSSSSNPLLPGRRPKAESQAGAGCKDINLQSVKLGGKQLSKEQYQRTDPS